MGGATPSFAEAPRKELRQSHSVPWGVVNRPNSPQARGRTVPEASDFSAGQHRCCLAEAKRLAKVWLLMGVRWPAI